MGVKQESHDSGQGYINADGVVLQNLLGLFWIWKVVHAVCKQGVWQ